MKNYFLNIFTVIVLIALSNVSIYACWCRRDSEETRTNENFTKTIGLLINSSDFVFSGTLVEENNEQLIFKIQESWKGNLIDKITFFSPHNVTDNGEREYFIDSCAYTFELGKTYLVYANVTLNGLAVNKCSRTNVLMNAQRDIDELNQQKQKNISSEIKFNSSHNYKNNYVKTDFFSNTILDNNF